MMPLSLPSPHMHPRVLQQPVQSAMQTHSPPHATSLPWGCAAVFGQTQVPVSAAQMAQHHHQQVQRQSQPCIPGRATLFTPAQQHQQQQHQQVQPEADGGEAAAEVVARRLAAKLDAQGSQVAAHGAVPPRLLRAEEVTVDQCIGRGEFSQVRRGRVMSRVHRRCSSSDGERDPPAGSTVAAVKELLVDKPGSGASGGSVSLQTMKDLETEVEALLLCAGHRNIISLLGAVMWPRLLLVVELVDGVTGEELIYGQAGAPDMAVGQVTQGRRNASGLAPLEVVSICQQLAEALAWLHSRVPLCIIHRDVAPKNVMVTSSTPRTLKLIDFGFAAFGAYPNSFQLTGSPKYVGPEMYSAPQLDAKLDVWAMACTWAEFYGAGKPYPEVKSMPELRQAHLMKRAPYARLPESMPPRLQRLTAQCFSSVPQQRISSLSAAAALRQACANTPTPQGPAQQRASTSVVPNHSKESCGNEAMADKAQQESQGRGALSYNPLPRALAGARVNSNSQSYSNSHLPLQQQWQGNGAADAASARTKATGHARSRTASSNSPSPAPGARASTPQPPHPQQRARTAVHRERSATENVNSNMPEGVTVLLAGSSTPKQAMASQQRRPPVPIPPVPINMLSARQQQHLGRHESPCRSQPNGQAGSGSNTPSTATGTQRGANAELQGKEFMDSAKQPVAQRLRSVGPQPAATRAPTPPMRRFSAHVSCSTDDLLLLQHSYSTSGPSLQRATSGTASATSTSSTSASSAHGGTSTACSSFRRGTPTGEQSAQGGSGRRTPVAGPQSTTGPTQHSYTPLPTGGNWPPPPPGAASQSRARAAGPTVSRRPTAGVRSPNSAPHPTHAAGGSHQPPQSMELQQQQRGQQVVVGSVPKQQQQQQQQPQQQQQQRQPQQQPQQQQGAAPSTVSARSAAAAPQPHPFQQQRQQHPQQAQQYQFRQATGPGGHAASYHPPQRVQSQYPPYQQAQPRPGPPGSVGVAASASAGGLWMRQ